MSGEKMRGMRLYIKHKPIITIYFIFKKLKIWSLYDQKYLFSRRHINFFCPFLFSLFLFSQIIKKYENYAILTYSKRKREKHLYKENNNISYSWNRAYSCNIPFHTFLYIQIFYHVYWKTHQKFFQDSYVIPNIQK